MAMHTEFVGSRARHLFLQTVTTTGMDFAPRQSDIEKSDICPQDFRWLKASECFKATFWSVLYSFVKI